MRIIEMLLATTAAIGIGASETQAGEHGHRGGEAIVDHVFEVADSDQDGTLSSAEYDEAGLAEFGLDFAACDADADGELTQGEYLEIYRLHHSSHGESEV